MAIREYYACQSEPVYRRSWSELLIDGPLWSTFSNFRLWPHWDIRDPLGSTEANGRPVSIRVRPRRLPEGFAGDAAKLEGARVGRQCAAFRRATSMSRYFHGSKKKESGFKPSSQGCASTLRYRYVPSISGMYAAASWDIFS